MEREEYTADLTTQTAAQSDTQVIVQSADPSQVMRQFVKAATVRAVRTMAQTAASLLGAKALISDVDWKALISATVMAGILSILTSVYSGLPETGTVNFTTEGAK